MKLSTMAILILFLNGCASGKMETQFSCGIGKGLGCKSVSEVNHIVDVQNIKNTPPRREPEKNLKIWFPPHVDEQDNWVEELVVYTVVKDAQWKRK